MGPPGDVPKPARFANWVGQGLVGRSPLPDDILVLTSDGSFRADTGGAGWAVSLSLVSDSVLALPGTFIGCLFGSLEPYRRILSEQRIHAEFDAYLAEVCGLLWAAVAALQLPFSGALLFRADNLSALQGVAGQANLRDHALCVVARNFFAAIQSLSSCTVHFQHVHGHSGDAANELADGLASLGSAGRQSVFPFACDLGFWLSDRGLVSDWLPHLCLSRSRPAEVPRLQHDLMTWTQDEPVRSLPASLVMQPFLRAVPSLGTEGADCGEDVEVSLVTYNVLSLLGVATSATAAGLHGATGRPSLLARVLADRGIHVAGLQECRTPRGTYHCGAYKRFASGCDEAACFGVELWVALTGPFRSDAVAILHTEPTALIATIGFRQTHFRILVGHAPHRAHTEQVRAEWWSRISGLCHSFSSGASWIFLVDGNCRVGSEVSAVVGPHQPDVEGLSGTAFRGLLFELRAWVPATFSECMQGDGGTLCLHRNGEIVRSDYVGVPIEWRSGRICAHVDPGITTGHSCVDHFAACLKVTLKFTGHRRTPRARRIDAAAVSHPENAPVVKSILRSAPRPAWNVDVSEHAALLVDHLYSGLVRHFPLTSNRMHGAHFSERASELHRAVATLRHNVRARKLALRNTRLRCAFLAWRDRRDTFCQLFQGKWLWHLRHRLALSCMLLHRAGTNLRTQCRVDRAAYFSAAADDIAESRPGEIHQSVKKVMRPKRFRKVTADPLPLLHRADGTLCKSAQEAQDAWREHFSALEDGVPVSSEDLVASCRAWQDSFAGEDTVNVAHVPALRALECAFRAASARKASGPDLLPTAICRFFSSDLSLLFWPLMLKTVLQAAEAAGLKGGLLHHIPKPNSALQGRCEGHRGILVQSAISKAIHRSMRGLAMDQWLPHALPVQIGGRRGCSAHFGHFCSRAFLSVMKAAGVSAGILFVDLAAAYYRVVRETILGDKLTGRGIDQIAATLHLSSDDLQLLRAHISSHPVLCEQESAPLFLEIAREMHSHTWFVLANDHQVVQTHRGTRPGGALADVIFNLLFSRVLHRRSQGNGDLGAPTIEWDGNRNPFGDSRSGQSVVSLRLQDVVFADDLASFVCADQAAHLRPQLGCVAAATLNVLPEHGLSANIGPTKTAAVVALHGRGSRAARRELFQHMRGKLPVWPENSGVVTLDLVTVYKHLGSVLTHDGSLLAEIKHRLAVGRAAFKEGKQRLFSCQRVPLSRRAILFRSHVLSAVLAGCGAWPALGPTEWKAFSGGLFSLFRQLLSLRSEEWRVTEGQIYARIGLPCPRSLLNAERLRFLLLLVRSGPDVAWALLRRFEPYLQGLQEASDWLLAAIGGTCELQDIRSSWPAWESLLTQSPGRFKGLIKRAELWHCEARSVQAALETFARCVWPPVCGPNNSGLAECEHACLICKIAFRTRQALARPTDISYFAVDETAAHEQMPAQDVLLVLHPEHLCNKIAG
ncbi:hypothetical protein AK812_SmicGene15780, partial [Symbiodinium microadriaticum]